MNRLFFGVILLAIPLIVKGQVPTATIYDIQFTTSPDGAIDPNWVGKVINCTGGIVTALSNSTRPRIIIQDPNFPDAWGGIQAKDINYEGYFDGIQIGDNVRLYNVIAEDYRGTTFLELYPANNPQVVIVSRNNPVPEPLRVGLDKIRSPVYDPVNVSAFVPDHNAEKYEGMMLRVVSVVHDRTIDYQYDLGKAEDNYVLRSADGPADPNLTCWAADYMNPDRIGWDPYHEQILTIPDGESRFFCSVTGVLEQYTLLEYDWDYYQLLTLTGSDFHLFDLADFNEDCMVDLKDYSMLAEQWQNDDCADPNQCSTGVLAEPVDTVDLDDLAVFSDNWLKKQN